MSKYLKQSIIIVFLTLGLVFLANAAILAWTAPTQAPPAGNVAAPINVSNVAQSKLGDLSIGQNLKYWITQYYDSFALKNNAGDIKFVVGQDGNVGIGTTGPGYKLEVVTPSGTNAPITARHNAWGVGQESRLNLALQYGVMGYVSSGLVETTSDTSYIALNYKSGLSSWAEGLRIYNNGNVGIGTTGPGAKLEVNGDLRFTETDNDFVTLSEVTPDNDNKVTLRLTLADDNSDMEKFEIFTDYWSGTANDKTVHYFTAAGNVYHSGNVGIGTASPAAKLTVQTPDGYNGNTIRFESKANSSLYFLNLNTVVTNGVVRWVFDQTNNGTSYANVLSFDRGNVGIGTAGPTGLLHLSSTAAQDLFRVDDDGAGDTSPFVINSTGNVGIGTTNPGHKLEVDGSTKVNGIFSSNGTLKTDYSISSYEYSTQRYIIEATPARVGVVIQIGSFDNNGTIAQFCADKDGCLVTIAMVNFDGEGTIASREDRLFIEESGDVQRRWRFTNNDISGIDGDRVTHEWCFFDCCFTDAEFPQYDNARYDSFSLGFGLLNYKGGSYSDAYTTCRVIIQD